MTSFVSLVLAVMLLDGPGEAVSDPGLRAKVAREADAGYEPPKAKEARIRSVRSDFDREEGVAMFEGSVLVEYGDDYDLAADRLFVFLANTNRLVRLVASGSVALTNGLRTGSCALATFHKAANRVEMYGCAGRPAELVEGKDRLQGDRITFWIDTERVEVVRPNISVENKGGYKR